jgi:DNA-binding response OmpR family regulator
MVVLAGDGLPAPVREWLGEREAVVLVPAGDVRAQARALAGLGLVLDVPEPRAGPAPLSPAPAPGPGPAPIRFHRLEVDLAERRARWDGRELGLSERELELLALLAERGGRACSFKELFTRIWGERYRVDPPVVHTAMRRLRRKLEAAAAEVVLESVRGYGFRMSAGNPGVTVD